MALYNSKLIPPMSDEILAFATEKKKIIFFFQSHIRAKIDADGRNSRRLLAADRGRAPTVVVASLLVVPVVVSCPFSVRIRPLLCSPDCPFCTYLSGMHSISKFRIGHRAHFDHSRCFCCRSHQDWPVS